MDAERAGRVIVTGAGGFVGTHLVRRLRDVGIPVVAVLRTPTAAGSLDPGLTVIARDLARSTLSDVIRPGDLVVHLAARVHRMREVSQDAAAEYDKANVVIARMLARSLAERGARRLVFLSTAKVFGEGRDRPYTETDALAPADAYAESKAAAEQVVRDIAGAGGFEWTIVRPPFVYGQGGKGNFPRLVALARLARIVPLPLASVDNRRSIVYVGNLVDAIVRCGVDPRADRRVLLPTDAEDVSTPELLRAIARSDGARARLFGCPPALLRAAARMIGRSGEMERLTESLRLDSRYLRDEFDWRPPFSLDRALAESIASTHSRARAEAG